MRLLPVLLALLAMVGAIALAAALVVPQRLDPASLRAVVETAASERLGAAVRIDGPVVLTLLPRPMLEAHDVSLLHGAPGDPDALALTAAGLRLRLGLTALLAGRLEVASVTLDRAELRLSWPFDLRTLAGRPAVLRTAALALHQSRVLLGRAVLEDVEASVTADPTGDVTLAGTGRRADATAWRGRLHLSRPGADGAAALEAALDEIYVADGSSLTLRGQLAGDGRFGGTAAAWGPNLWRLIAAPPLAFHAEGRATLEGGVARIADGIVALDGAPARLEASWQFAPPRLEARVAASRVDLDAWRAALRTAAAALPLTVTFSADAGSMGGATLRDLHAEGSVTGNDLTLSRASATLPGDMTVSVGGRLDGSGEAALDVQVDGADLRATLGWLRRLGGTLPTLPATAPRRLTGHATVETARSGGATEWELHGMVGSLDGAALRGDALLTLRPGQRPNLAALLSLDRMEVAPWLESDPLPGIDVALDLTLPHALWAGTDSAVEAGVTRTGESLIIRRLAIANPHLHASGAGRRDGLRWSDVTARLDTDRPVAAIALLPDSLHLPSWVRLPGNLSFTLVGGGPAEALSGSVVADWGDLHAELTPTLGTDPHGSVILRHPSARRLATDLGLSTTWLDDGALDLRGTMDLGSVIRFDGHAAAGAHKATMALALDRSRTVPALAGTLRLGRLEVPRLDHGPLPLDALRGLSAEIALTIEAVGPLSSISTQASLADGVLVLRDLQASLAGGALTGGVSLDAADPPTVAAELSLADAAIEGVWTGLPLDLVGGQVRGQARLTAQGHSAAALLATLSGRVEASAPGAALSGIDVAALGDLSEAAVAAALAGGRTPLDGVRGAATLDHGLATIDLSATSTSAALAGHGTLDLSTVAFDGELGILPSVAGSPRIGLRLGGIGRDATVTPALTDLVRWRAAREDAGASGN